MANWISAGADAVNALGGIFGGFGGSSASARATQRQYEYNLALQKDAQAWNERMYKNRYQYQVQDLEKAGINKLYGLGTAPSVTTGMNSVGLGDDVGEQNGKMQSILNAIGLATDWSAKKAQIKVADHEAKLKEQQTRTEEQQTELKKLEQINQYIKNLQDKKNLDWTDKINLENLKKTKSETIKNLSEASKIPSEIANNYAQAGNARANANKTKTETGILNEQTTATREQAKAEEEFLKAHPRLRGIIGGANAMSGIFKNIATGTGTAMVVGSAIRANERTKDTANKQYRRNNTARKNKK